MGCVMLIGFGLTTGDENGHVTFERMTIMSEK